jgi:hypothetical protein
LPRTGIAMMGYGQRSGSPWIIVGSFCAYAGVLECLQHFSPGRTPAFSDFAASALGQGCSKCCSKRAFHMCRWSHSNTLSLQIFPNPLKLLESQAAGSARLPEGLQRRGLGHGVIPSLTKRLVLT